jgi:predicted DNA-binding transcriptional regulator YafY
VAQALIAPDIWNAVIEALRGNRILAFEYRGSKDSGFKRRCVHPYQLLFDNGSWCIYAYTEERSAVRLFALSRMRNVVLTKESFKLPADYDFCAHTGGSFFGMYSGDEKRRYRIRFYADAVPGIKERKWAEDQVIEEYEDSLLMDFTSTQFLKILEWVLSHGRYAVPLAPAALVNEWRKNIEDMQKNAKF